MRLRNLFLFLVLLVSPSLVAQIRIFTLPPAPLEMPSYKPEHPTKAFLNEKHFLEKVQKPWLKTFHMEDWDINLTPVPLSVLKENCVRSCFAVSWWDGEYHRGTVFVLERSEYTPEMKKELKEAQIGLKEDQRNSVVHELLHNVLLNMHQEAAVQILTNLLKP